MNVSASSIPCPVHDHQLSRRLVRSSIPRSDSGKGRTLLLRPSGKVAFYLRSATVERANIDKQLNMLFDFAAQQNGWNIATCFIDWGSGLETGPGLRAMISAMTSPNCGFDVILVTDMSRISRNIQIRKEIQKTASSSAIALLSLCQIDATNVWSHKLTRHLGR